MHRTYRIFECRLVCGTLRSRRLRFVPMIPIIFALIGLLLSSLAVAHASSSIADSVHFCLPFDYEQWRRDHPRPAGKASQALNRGEPRTVRMIYFLPNDRPYRPAAVDTLKMRMRRVQNFFANQMSAHGYGPQSFLFEKDTAGEPLVHRVDGKHPASHYKTYLSSLEEIASVFDIDMSNYLVILDYGDDRGGGVAYSYSGLAFVSYSSSIKTYAHELGHLFGLAHDFRDDDYVMSYGYMPDTEFDTTQLLSFCSAQSLIVNPYFNRQNPIQYGYRYGTSRSSAEGVTPLTSSPINTEGATSISVRARLRDPDGLHHAILLTEGVYGQEVISCQGLDGQTTTVVEFDHDGVIPSIPESDFTSSRSQILRIVTLDVLGDFTGLNTLYEDFELINNKYKGPIVDFETPDGAPIDGMAFLSRENWIGFLGGTELWNLLTGRFINSLPISEPVGDMVAFSADTKSVALESSDGSIEVWDIRDGSYLVSIVSIRTSHKNTRNRPPYVSALALSPDGKLLASGGWYDSDVHIWNTTTGDHVSTVFTGPDYGRVVSLVFSPDGKLLASLINVSYHKSVIKVWDTASQKNIATILEPHKLVSRYWGGSSHLSFSPDGKLLASAGGLPRYWSNFLDPTLQTSEVKLWDVATGKNVISLPGSDPLIFSPDGKFLASASERWIIRRRISRDKIAGGGTVKLWNVNTMKLVNSFPVSSTVKEIYGLKFSSENEVLAVRGYGTYMRSRGVAQLWDLSEWTGPAEPKTTPVEQSMPHTLTKVSGDGQAGRVGAALSNPFVVSVLDQNGAAFAGAVVTFSIAAGGGLLSSTTVTTDASGRASSTLTLGNEPGTNTVEATVAGLRTVTFTATATEQTAHTLTKVSGDSQAGPASTQLAAPFVVSVLDQDGSPLPDIDATFSIAAGGGMLSSTTDANPCIFTVSTSSITATTDTNGRATARLTLGSEPGTNTVEVTVSELEPVTFTATAAEQAMPHRLTKVCGDGQEGTASTQLATPFMVLVSDEDGAVIAGVDVSFTVTAGGGRLSSATATTNANGRARSTLTLGSEPGTNTVEATVAGLEPVTFTATGQEDPLATLFDLFGSGKRAALPDSPQLAQNAPNPFNSQTILSYFLPEPGLIRLEVFALTGQRVAVLSHGPQQAGYHRLHWEGRDAAGRPVASGVYLYRLVTDETVLTRKLILLR